MPDRGSRPRRPQGKVPEPPPPTSTDGETPKFCLAFVRRGFDVETLTTEQQASLAKTLQKLAGFKWKDLMLGRKHSHGLEHLPVNRLTQPVPERFQDQDKVTVFRYHGKLPMAGFRVRDVFHILWIEPAFGKLYDHG